MDIYIYICVSTRIFERLIHGHAIDFGTRYYRYSSHIIFAYALFLSLCIGTYTMAYKISTGNNLQPTTHELVHRLKLFQAIAIFDFVLILFFFREKISNEPVQRAHTQTYTMHIKRNGMYKHWSVIGGMSSRKRMNEQKSIVLISIL